VNSLETGQSRISIKRVRSLLRRGRGSGRCRRRWGDRGYQGAWAVEAGATGAKVFGASVRLGSSIVVAGTLGPEGNFCVAR
jgi:hypothetical protein